MLNAIPALAKSVQMKLEPGDTYFDVGATRAERR